MLIVFANFQNINFDLLLYLYIAKSFFLLGSKYTSYFSILTGIGWITSECISEIKYLDSIRYEKLRDRDLDEAFRAIDLAVVLSAQCIEDVSHAVHTMRRNDFNLNHALTNLMEQIRNDSASIVKWKINLPQLPLSTSHQIYCVVKEGLINTKKHAYPSAVSFQGYSTGEDIILKLKDDGVGFDRQHASSGFGLKGMHERVQTLNGKLAIDSAPGKGTQILVTIPQ